MIELGSFVESNGIGVVEMSDISAIQDDIFHCNNTIRQSILELMTPCQHFHHEVGITSLVMSQSVTYFHQNHTFDMTRGCNLHRY